MEALLHQHEEGIGQNAREGPDDARSQQLDAHEFNLVGRQEPFVFVDQAECDDTPKAAKQMRLCCLQWIVELPLVENHASDEVDESTDRTNNHCRVNFDVT